MELNKELTLNYAEEFRIACTINNLRYEDVLQSFVNAASFYVFIGGEIDAAAQWATKVILDCKEEVNGKVSMSSDQLMRERSLKYVNMLKELSTADHLSRQIKFKKSEAIMKNWEEAIFAEDDPHDHVEINGNYNLTISFDFRMLCSINGVSTNQVLQYFIDMISLAEDRALNLYTIIKVNPGTAFTLLLLIKDNNTRSRRLPQEQIYVKYGLQLLDLDEKLEDEIEFKYRVKAYRRFYQEWYNALRVMIN